MLPSGRSIVVGLAVFALAAGAYAAARETSVFAVRTITVRGGTPAVKRQVLAALRPEVGTSLLRVDRAAIDSSLAEVPRVASARFDRSFPHTLVVVVRPERPVAVLRQGTRSYLVSATGRVLQRLRHGARAALPRIWVPQKASVEVGGTLGVADGGRAARALSPLASVHFPARVTAVKAGEDKLTFVLRSHLELRFGDPSKLRLKLAIARRILADLGPTAPGGYVDVSVPQRPVAFTNPQVEG